VHDDGYFDERVAAKYDDDASDLFDPEVLGPAIDFLAELAGSGRALELGIGTGRIALPLAQRGVEVHGIDLSDAMVAKLRVKPGGEDVGVTIGDFATTKVDGSFALVYVVFNTIMNLTTQEAQIACFRNAAAHLEPGGCFVVEVMIPELQRLPPGETFRVFSGSERYWGIDEYDVANQGLISHHLELVGDKVERVSMPFRYAFPAEYDLMAQLAGDDVARAVGRVEARAVHERKRQARVGLGEALRASNHERREEGGPGGRTERDISARSSRARNARPAPGARVRSRIANTRSRRVIGPQVGRSGRPRRGPAHRGCRSRSRTSPSPRGCSRAS
jgi:SAM-dependent methyltransferase